MADYRHLRQWQMVTCRECKDHYQCTPFSDYYGATTLIDGLCELCLCISAGLDPDGAGFIEKGDMP